MQIADQLQNARECRPFRRRVRMKSLWRIAFLLATLSCTQPFGIQAQTGDPTGTVQGRIFLLGSDGSAQVVGAAVVLTGPQVRKTETDQEGRYAFETLPPGTYQIEAVVSGLHAQQTITVEAHKTTEIDLPTKTRRTKEHGHGNSDSD
jgi:hypothetical protein